jgi:hypothetical protein
MSRSSPPHGVSESGGLPGNASRVEAAKCDSGLLTKGGTARGGGKVCLGAQAVPRRDQDVDVALHRPGVRPIGIACFDRDALVKHVRNGRQKPRRISPVGGHFWLVPVAARQDTGADDYREDADSYSPMSHGARQSSVALTSLKMKGEWAVQQRTARLIRPSLPHKRPAGIT